MAYEIIPNTILFLAIAGMLGLFFRHVPEVVVEERSDIRSRVAATLDGSEDAAVGKKAWYQKDYAAMVGNAAQAAWQPVRRVGVSVAQKSWQFMLEAKDLKQGQILASKFARMVTPNAQRYTSPAVHTPMSDAEDLFRAGDYDAAEEKYFEILKKFPHEYTAYEGLVKIYLQQKQYDNLTETLEYLVRHVPENDSYWAQYGNVLMSTRQYQQAIPALEKAVELNGLIPSRYANLGLSQLAVEQLAEAKNSFRKAADLEPSNVQYLVLLTDCMIQLDEREAAKELLQKAAEMLPENLEIREKIIALDRQ